MLCHVVVRYDFLEIGMKEPRLILLCRRLALFLRSIGEGMVVMRIIFEGKMGARQNMYLEYYEVD